MAALCEPRQYPTSEDMVPDSHLPTALPMGTCQLASPTCASLDHAAWRSRFEFSRPLWSSVHRRRGNARQCFLKSARRPLRCTGRILCSFPRIRLGSLKPRGQRSLADLKMGISASLLVTWQKSLPNCSRGFRLRSIPFCSRKQTLQRRPSRVSTYMPAKVDRGTSAMKLPSDLLHPSLRHCRGQVLICSFR